MSRISPRRSPNALCVSSWPKWAPNPRKMRPSSLSQSRSLSRPRNTKTPRPVAISRRIRARSSAIVASGNSSRRTGVSYALRPPKRPTAASISSSVAGDNRTIQSSVATRSLPSQTDLPLGRYGGWNVIGTSSTHAGAACAASRLPARITLSLLWFHAQIIDDPPGSPWAAPLRPRPWPATAFDVALAFLSPVFLNILGHPWTGDPHGPTVCRLRLHLHPVDGSPARAQRGVWAGRVPNAACKISRSVSRRRHQRCACPNRRRQVAGEVGPAGHHREPQRRQRQHRCRAGGAGGARWPYAHGLGNAAARHQPEPL